MTFTYPETLKLSETEYAQQQADHKHLHQNPELSNQEYETAAYLERQFEAMPLAEGVERTVHRVGETGLAVVLKNGDGPVVGYRADTDGLPIKEESNSPYPSVATTLVNGAETPLMHACGHDTHMAVALGAARIFARSADEWSGTIVFVLQPAEEVGDGARSMVDAGLWDVAPKPQVMFGQHVFPLPRGHFVVSAGEFLAASDSLDVTVYGRGGHGSQPETTIDPIVLAAAMVTRLQTVVAREVSPLDSAVVTVGMFHAGSKNNIIPDKAQFTLNIRTFNSTTRERVLEAIERIIRGEATVAGAPDPLIEQQPSFPATINDAAETARVQSLLTQVFGPERVVTDDTLRFMGSEDFSLLATAIDVPYVFWGFGGVEMSLFESGEAPGNHSPFFAPDPEVTLEAGTEAAVAVVLDALGRFEAA